MKKQKFDGYPYIVASFIMIVAYFLLVFTGWLDKLGNVSIYLALLVSAALAIGALVSSLVLYSPRSDYKPIMRFAATIISLGLIWFTVYVFFIPVEGFPPPITWFYKG